ncbi:MAG: hypothetical protein Q4G13_03015 [Moraxella sp.]|nr:hypothetical protein [Moraxella sp.]
MLSLDLTASELEQLELASQQAGMSVAQYAMSRLFPIPAQPKSIASMVKGKRLESFQGDPVAIQRAMRDE